MSMQLSARSLFIISFLVLLISNIVVLTGIAANRKGTPVNQLTLTERELGLVHRYRKENNGVALRLEWRAMNRDREFYSRFTSNSGSPSWFNAEKLEQLGFDLSSFRAVESSYKRERTPLAKEVLIVLENNSDLHQKAIAWAQKEYNKHQAQFALDKSDKQTKRRFEQAEKQLQREQFSASRLFAIDAGLDLATLQQKYNDPSRYIFAKGIVKPRSFYTKGNRDRNITGYIQHLSISQVHVSLEHKAFFDKLLNVKRDRSQPEKPRYQVELAYGKRLEPWLQSVTVLDAK